MIKIKKLKNLKQLVFLTLFIISSCLEPPPCKNLNVPYRQQINSYSCGAACVQMWANYRGNNVSQQTIINYMEITGASPSIIADAAVFYCNLFIIASCTAEGPDEQNHSISD